MSRFKDVQKSEVSERAWEKERRHLWRKTSMATLVRRAQQIQVGVCSTWNRLLTAHILGRAFLATRKLNADCHLLTKKDKLSFYCYHFTKEFHVDILSLAISWIFNLNTYLIIHYGLLVMNIKFILSYEIGKVSTAYLILIIK